MRFEFKDAVRDFFCGIKSRIVHKYAYFRDASISYYFNFNKKISRLSINFLFDKSDYDGFNIPFRITLLNPSCSCKLCPSCVYDWYFSYEECDLVPSSYPNGLFCPPKKQTFLFVPSQKSVCIGDIPQNCCDKFKKKNADGRLGDLKAGGIILTASNVSINYYGAVREMYCDKTHKSLDFNFSCSAKSEEAIIEYNRDFIDFILSRYGSYVLTFSKEEDVKNTLLKIKSLLGG